MADIITYPEQGILYDADDAAGYLATRLSGVYSAEEDFAVTAVEGLSVQVSAGQAWVRPARFKGRSIIMEQPTTVVLTEADPVRSRIDRLVLRYDAAAKKTTLGVLDGTPDSAEPVAPDITRTALVYDLCLAEIRRAAGSTEVTAADIFDTRADEAVCGVMRDGVHGIPAATLIQRLRDEIDKVDKGSFYDKTETDALLDALQEQVDSKISSATSIAASGSNYIRFTDGTQICWGRSNDQYSSARKFTHPVPFVDTNYYIGTAYYGTRTYEGTCTYVGYGSNSWIGSAYINAPATTYCVVAGTGTEARYIAVGRWK